MTSIEEDMNNHLDQFADAYNSNGVYSLDARLMSACYRRNVVQKSSCKSLLELGIGHGRSASFFSRHFERHVVVEGAQEVIRRYLASYDNQKTEIIQSYFESFETTEKFDSIAMGFVLEHVENPVLVLKNFSRFLDPAGVIYIAVPNATSLHRQIGVASGLLDDVHCLSEFDHKLGHRRFYDIEKLHTDIEQAGLSVRSVEGIFLKPFTTGQLESLDLSTDVLNALIVLGKNYPELCNAIWMEATL